MIDMGRDDKNGISAVPRKERRAMIVLLPRNDTLRLPYF
jgi:hypothetical protein